MQNQDKIGELTRHKTVVRKTALHALQTGDVPRAVERMAYALQLDCQLAQAKYQSFQEKTAVVKTAAETAEPQCVEVTFPERNGHHFGTPLPS